MPSREPGDAEDPAAELLDRWQAHLESSDDAPAPPADLAPRTASHRRTRPDAAPYRPRERSTDAVSAAREVREAFGLSTDEHVEAEIETHLEDVETHQVDETPVAPPVPARRSRVTAPEEGLSTDVHFAPRVGSRRILGLLLVFSLVATGGAGYVAYDEPRTLSVGIACTLLFVTLVLYAVRAGSSPTRLVIHAGQLEVVRGSKREIFDLTSRYTRVQVVGRPGRRGWKVLLGRFGRDPLVIDSSVVDPRAFTEALARFRPPED